ncbi:MAG TPA: N-6 DNA methylase [Gemmatimonadaceae bacterium]|nr:N-6 DNA methylase [Gemmatimonadaceae bacterium]
MHAAAALLSSARTISGLADIVRATGLAGAPVQLDAGACTALGLEAVDYTEIAAGPGALRVLLVQLKGSAIRDALQQLARRLSARAPHVLWVVAAVEHDGASAALMSWTSGDRPRIASLLWEPNHVVDSDAETLCALAALGEDVDVLLHARCVDVLGRDALTRRFYRALEARVRALAEHVPASAEDARTVALLYASRLLFLCFLEAKGWLNGNRAFLGAQFDECMRRGGGYHDRVLRPLFFGTLNTPIAKRSAVSRAFGHIPFLNGGLFTRTAAERRVGRWRFDDEQLGALLGQLFQRFRFVAREDTATWSEASVDPEMLGRAFESLMVSAERRAGGVYYTPHPLVGRVAEHALSAALDGCALSPEDLRVLDPACGSGAFLVFVLERLAELRLARGERRSLAEVRRHVLAQSIFGVDRSPTAVWLCELRLWLSVVIESQERDPRRVPPLPNLDRNIRVGDALSGAAFSRDLRDMAGGARVVELRQRYVRATGVRKQHLSHMLDREERRRAQAQNEREIAAARFARRELIAVQRGTDLFGQHSPTSPDAKRELRRLRDLIRSLTNERRRLHDGGALPFSFGACFADVQARTGFDVILGNPPWVRLHRIPAPLRLQFKRAYEVFRSAPWTAAAAGDRTAPGFASQVDLAALFVERSVSLLRTGGVVSLLLPAKLWHSLAGGGVRSFLLRRTRIGRLEDYSESRQAFDAAVYPSLLVARADAGGAAPVSVAVHDRTTRRAWSAEMSALTFDQTPGAPWILLPPDARQAFERVRNAGLPLVASAFGAPRLGVKSGCNAAFIVRVEGAPSENGLVCIVDADGERGMIEASLLRPALRGVSIVPWEREQAREWIIWTHDASGAPLAHLPNRARAWLRRRYDDLSTRTDAARARRWWSLFRVDAADTSASRVVWADIGRAPRGLVLAAGDPAVPLNTCYVIRCPDARDAWALAALINSPLAAGWLNALAEPARGGYRRYLAWTVGQLPLPSDWTRARDILSRAARSDPQTLLDAALRAYRLDRSDIAALLDGSP